MTGKSRKSFYAGIVLFLYGLVGILFEILNTSYSKTAEIIWAILNPVFVVSVGLTRLVPLSFYADMSTPQTSVATLSYWAYPTILITVGLFLAFKE